MIEIGMDFYDERNGREVTVIGATCDPHTWECRCQEFDEEGNCTELETSLLTDTELGHFNKVERW
jgi:hypothetical protein